MISIYFLIIPNRNNSINILLSIKKMNDVTTNVLTVLSLIALPSLQEYNGDFSSFNSNRTKLVTQLFDSKNYDNRKSSHHPIDITTLLVVDHVENMNEDAQTLRFHGKLALIWKDNRLVWDPRDYAGITVIDISDEFYRMWRPSIYFRTL